MILFEEMGRSVANLLIVYYNGILHADDTIFVFIGFIIFFDYLHEKIYSRLIGPFRLLLSISLVFLFSFICGCICGCMCDSGVFNSITFIEFCRMLLLTPSTILLVLVLLL